LRSADNGQHVPPRPSLKGFLRNAEVNHFDSLRLGIEEDVLWLYVSVADISLMYMGNHFKKLGKNEFQFLNIESNTF
jgi:hypothetical protein